MRFSTSNASITAFLDVSIPTLDAPAHLDDVNEAVLQDVVNVVGQTRTGRATRI